MGKWVFKAKNKIILLVLLVVFLFSSFVAAEVVTVTNSAMPPPVLLEVTPVLDAVINQGYGIYILKITNNQKSKDTFRVLHAEDPEWTFQIVPTIDREKTLISGSSNTVKIYVKPSTNVKKGFYNVAIKVRSELTGNVYGTVLKIQIGKDPEPLNLLPSFNVTASIPSKMDPRNVYQVVVNLANNNAKNLEDVEVRLNSNLIKEKTDVDLKGSEEKGVSFAIMLMESLKPQTDSLQVIVSYKNKTVYDQYHNYEVVEYIPPFKKSVAVFDKLFKTVREINLTNEGNVKKSDTIKLGTTLRERMFTRTYPSADVVKGTVGSFYAWKINLDPNKTVSIKIVTSYRILVWLILIILGALIYYYSIKNPIILRKQLKKIKKEQGAVTAVTVILHIKNRSSKTVSKVRLVEPVPDMLSIKRNSFEGSVHPSKMHHKGKHGTLLEYTLNELEPREERMFKYTVYSKLHIMGGFKIKPTLAEFKEESGKKMRSKSNSLSVAELEN